VTSPGGQDSADRYTGELLRLTALTERLGSLDARESEHYQAIGRRLGEIAQNLAAMREHNEALASTLAEQADILASLEDIDQRLIALARDHASDGAEPAGDDNGGGEEAAGRTYHPGPPPPWWRLGTDPAPDLVTQALAGNGVSHHQARPGDAGDLAEAIRRLHDWVTHVYQPGYGHLAAGLSACWAQHPLCLYTLDWLCELWSVLYLNSRRTPATLAGQAEFTTRLLPAAAAQMEAETSGCTHCAVRPGAARARPLDAPVT
jgi:hypothetical protein